MKLSIAIPVWECYGEGLSLLKRNLDSLQTQTFKDFEVIVSDNSYNDVLEGLCKNYDLDIGYFRNPNRGMAVNSNNAIRKSQGDLVKILYQDDYLAYDQALQTIVDNFSKQDNWLITACSNNPFPYYSQFNTLGPPSVLTLRERMYFNENLKWTLDLDLYHRLYDKFGEPKIINDVNVVIGLGSHQETNHLTNEEKYKEEHPSIETHN